MNKWGPSRWLPRFWAAITRRKPHTHFVARLNEIGGEPGNGPRPDFRTRLRGELLAARAAGADPGPEATGRRRRPPFLMRLRPGVLIVVVTGLLLVACVGAYASVPGDRLYPIKRAAEATLLSLTTDDAERAQRELNAAHSRATEAAALLGYPDSRRAQLIGPTLDEMASTTRSALSALGHVKRQGRHAPALKRFTDEQRDVVEPMIPQLGGDDRMKASAYLDMIDDLTP
ncbi:DUF5667 domain-containing protein [Sphaerisporangium corydalis]|uniref:DUF5667 domain-containing protein n=1 Tax=Sphaerisporangium corydalis TaxID=1441875 RepID=A0ABV9EKI4_9ACTN|nr:DUF5667 domain-containing protein [Sphaerisporangium corydalis]